MLHIIIRVLITFVIAIPYHLLCRKKNLSKSGKVALSVSAVGVCLVLWALPFETVFFTFDSPQAVFDYYKGGTVVDSADHNASGALIFEKDSNTHSVFFVQKKEDGYKMCPNYKVEKIANAKYESVHFFVYQIKGTNDYYLQVWGVVSEEVTLTDSENNVFDLKYEDHSSKKTLVAIEPINYDEGYCCYLNGDRVVFASK